MTCSVKVLETFSNALAHALLTLAHPDTRVKVLLVGLVVAVWVSDCLQQVILLAQNVIPHTAQVSVLQVSIQVDFDDAVRDGIQILLLGGTAATVEDQEHGLVVLAACLLLDIGLVLAEELRVQLHVARLVDTVDVAKAGSNAEVRADGGKCLVDLVDVLGLSVQAVVVDVLVVDTIFLTTRDADFLQSD